MRIGYHPEPYWWNYLLSVWAFAAVVRWHSRDSGTDDIWSADI